MTDDQKFTAFDAGNCELTSGLTQEDIELLEAPVEEADADTAAGKSVEKSAETEGNSDASSADPAEGFSPSAMFAHEPELFPEDEDEYSGLELGGASAVAAIVGLAAFDDADNDDNNDASDNTDSKEKLRVSGQFKKKIVLNPKLRTTLITSAIVVGIIAASALIIFLVSGGRGTVNVYSVGDVSVNDAWMGNSEHYGTVSDENMQSVFLSDTQTVLEVFVTEGQRVHKGDKLLTYDSSLSTIQLEKKNLELLQAQLALQQAKSELVRINSLVPYTPPAPTTTAPGDPVVGMTLIGGTGTSDDPFVYLSDDENVPIDNDFISDLCGWKPAVWMVSFTREGNITTGNIDSSVGLCFRNTGDGYSVSYFDPSSYLPQSGQDEEINFGSGFSSAEIAEMRKAQQQVIAEADLQQRLLQIEYDQMALEIDNGTVYSTVDGIVTSVNNDAAADSEIYEPYIKVAGGDGYIVESSVDEFSLDSVEIGQSVTIMSYDTGENFEGTVTDIIMMPTDGEDNYYGGIQTSYYPVLITVSPDADLYSDQWLSVTFRPSGGAAEKFYIEAPFVLSENGRSYVWAEGEDGRLEKREIITGANMYGSMYELISGLTTEDFIAFPYGKSIREGAKTKQSPIDELYNYYY